MCHMLVKMCCCTFNAIAVFVCILLTEILTKLSTRSLLSAKTRHSLISILSAFCLAASAQRGTRPVSAPVFSQAALMEAGIPMAPLDQPQTSTPIKTSRQEERKLQVTVEAVEPSKIEAGADAKVFSYSDRCCKSW